MKRSLTALLLLASSTPVLAQWLSIQTPGIPRTADGAPDLSAPAPRAADGRPDLSGLWRPERTRSGLRDRSNLQPWVNSLVDERDKRYFADSPRYRCLPVGPENLTSGSNSYGLRQLIQHPSQLVMLYNDGTFRQIFTDGRELERDPLPTWMGYAVGRWEGDTLVVESNGYNDKTWLGRGISHTNQLRMTERYTRTSFGHIQVEVTYEDPGALESKVESVIDMELAADEQMLETVCNEAYSGDRYDWGSEVEEKDLTEADIAPEILERYVGRYEGMYLANHTTIDITLDDGNLYLRKNNGGTSRLIPQSETAFLLGGFGYVFSVDENGAATTISEVHVSGAWPFHRVP
ncbi:MAG TPA: hypothetical protein VIV14_07845 [Gammaproteobacteria bacterium]